MLSPKFLTWFFICFWAVTLIVTFMGKMMIAMDLMAVGMLLGALSKLLSNQR